MLGREVRMPLDVMFGEGGSKSTLNHGEHVLHLKETLLNAHEIARLKAKNSAQRQKDNYDLHVRPYTYKVGDKVWYLQERADKGKLANIYIGPCTISKKHSDLTYQIRMNDENGRRKYRVIHHDKYLSASLDGPKIYKYIYYACLRVSLKQCILYFSVVSHYGSANGSKRQTGKNGVMSLCVRAASSTKGRSGMWRHTT